VKRFATITALVLLGVSSPGFSDHTPVAAAEAAAQKWLGLIDSQDYAQSWSTAAKHFRDSIPQAQWESKAAAVRRPLGAVTSRHVISARLAHSLLGVPDGDYVVIQFSTSFEHRATAMETVTPMKDADGQWRVSGYFIR
jgi:hypothetical protein